MTRMSIYGPFSFAGCKLRVRLVQFDVATWVGDDADDVIVVQEGLSTRRLRRGCCITNHLKPKTEGDALQTVGCWGPRGSRSIDSVKVWTILSVECVCEEGGEKERNLMTCASSAHTRIGQPTAPPHFPFRSTTTTLLPRAKYLAAAFNALTPAYLLCGACVGEIKKAQSVQKDVFSFSICSPRAAETGEVGARDDAIPADAGAVDSIGAPAAVTAAAVCAVAMSAATDAHFLYTILEQHAGKLMILRTTTSDRGLRLASRAQSGVREQACLTQLQQCTIRKPPLQN